MEFNKNRVYTALNADELKVGSKVYVADTLSRLKEKVENEYNEDTLSKIDKETELRRFVIKDRDDNYFYHLAYLISEPEEKKLKWTNLKIGDIIRNFLKDSEGQGYKYLMVTGIDESSKENHILTGKTWMSDEDLQYWKKVE